MCAATPSAHDRPRARDRFRARRALPLVPVVALLSAALSLSPVPAGAAPVSSVATLPSTTATTTISTTVDFSGDGHPDVIARTSTGTLYLYRGNGAGGFLGSRTVIGQGWQVFDHIFSPGDFSGDGHADLLARTPAGALYLYRGNGAGGFLGSGTVIGQGWQVYDRVFSPGDFTGDGHPDLIARVKGGALYLYRGNGAGGFLGGRTQIGAGWNMFDKVFGVGDFSGDGHPDLMGRTPAGSLYLYRGNGAGGFLGGGTVIGAGWNMFDKVFGVGDFTGDGHPDLMGRTPAGSLYLYRGNGRGGFLSGGQVIGAGWQVFNLLSGIG